MSLPFLKIPPEDAIAKIQDMSFAGYQIERLNEYEKFIRGHANTCGEEMIV